MATISIPSYSILTQNGFRGCLGTSNADFLPDTHVMLTMGELMQVYWHLASATGSASIEAEGNSVSVSGTTEELPRPPERNCITTSLVSRQLSDADSWPDPGGAEGDSINIWAGVSVNHLPAIAYTDGHGGPVIGYGFNGALVQVWAELYDPEDNITGTFIQVCTRDTPYRPGGGGIPSNATKTIESYNLGGITLLKITYVVTNSPWSSDPGEATLTDVNMFDPT